MALHLPIEPLKTHSGLGRYRYANPVPTIPLADDLATMSSGPVFLPNVKVPAGIAGR